MDTTLGTELDAADIIAAIMQDMEEVMDLIQRPIPGNALAAIRRDRPHGESEPVSVHDIS